MAQLFSFKIDNDKTIVMTGLFAVQPHNKSDMGPTQFATQRVANLLVRKCKIKLAKIPKVGVGESLPQVFAQMAG